MNDKSAQPPPTTLADGDLGAVGRSLLTDRVTDKIRAAILSGKLLAGERLSVPDLARRLGVSRTPAREALLVLEREGLVRQRAGSGMEVLQGDASDMREILEIREGLEAMVARLAAERMDAVDHARLRENLSQHRQALARGDISAHLELDHAFHDLLRTGAGNDRLADMLEQISHQLRVLNANLSGKRGWSSEAIIDDHQAIAEAVIAGNAVAAERTIRKHVRRVRAYWQSLEPKTQLRVLDPAGEVVPG